jgi:hypothetical protein
MNSLRQIRRFTCEEGDCGPMEDMDFQNFTFFVYRLTLEAQDRIELVRMNRGITLRGAFGTVFRRLVCHDLKAQCGPSCPLHSSCPYGFIFAPTVPADAARLRLNRDIPRPFVIKPPLDGDGTYKPGDHLVFDLVVIGRAQDFLPYFIVTFEEMGRQGIGIRRGRYKLGSLESLRRDGSWQKVFHREDRMVTPPAGAWIETRGAKAPRLRVRVAPCAGVWSVPRMDRDGAISDYALPITHYASLSPTCVGMNRGSDATKRVPPGRPSCRGVD